MNNIQDIIYGVLFYRINHLTFYFEKQNSIQSSAYVLCHVLYATSQKRSSRLFSFS